MLMNYCMYGIEIYTMFGIEVFPAIFLSCNTIARLPVCSSSLSKTCVKICFLKIYLLKNIFTNEWKKNIKHDISY